MISIGKVSPLLTITNHVRIQPANYESFTILLASDKVLATEVQPYEWLHYEILFGI